MNNLTIFIKRIRSLTISQARSMSHIMELDERIPPPPKLGKFPGGRFHDEGEYLYEVRKWLLDWFRLPVASLYGMSIEAWMLDLVSIERLLRWMACELPDGMDGKTQPELLTIAEMLVTLINDLLLCKE